MATAILKWTNLSIPDKILKARYIAEGIAANAAFISPNPTPATVLAAADALEQAQIKVIENGGGKKLTHQMYTCEGNLDKLMSRVLYYVNQASNGDGDMIMSAGLQLKKERTKRGLPHRVENLSAAPSGVSGSVVLRWNKMPGAIVYKALWSLDELPLNWRDFKHNVVTRTKMEVNGLPPGQIIWFTVMAINSAGEGPDSDPAMCRVG